MSFSSFRLLDFWVFLSRPLKLLIKQMTREVYPPPYTLWYYVNVYLKIKESQKLMAWQTKCWGRLLAKSCHWCRVSGIEYWGIVALWHWLGILAALERDWNIGNVSQLSVGIRKTKRSGQMLRANNVILMLFAVWWGFNYEKLSICLPPGRNGGKCGKRGKMRETARQMSHADRKKCPVIAALIPMDRKNRRCLQNDRE